MQTSGSLLHGPDFNALARASGTNPNDLFKLLTKTFPSKQCLSKSKQSRSSKPISPWLMLSTPHPPIQEVSSLIKIIDSPDRQHTACLLWKLHHAHHRNDGTRNKCTWSCAAENWDSSFCSCRGEARPSPFATRHHKVILLNLLIHTVATGQRQS